jgi:hypothetical protein
MLLFKSWLWPSFPSCLLPCKDTVFSILEDSVFKAPSWKQTLNQSGPLILDFPNFRTYDSQSWDGDYFIIRDPEVQGLAASPVSQGATKKKKGNITVLALLKFGDHCYTSIIIYPNNISCFLHEITPYVFFKTYNSYILPLSP